MKSDSIKHLVAVIFLILLAIIFCFPVLKGLTLYKQDTQNAYDMQHSTMEFVKKTGKYPYWNAYAFSGMPSYTNCPNGINGNYIAYVSRFYGLFPFPMCNIVIYLLCAYILFIAIGIDYRLAIIGSIAFSFSTYNIIILEVGHMTKAFGIGFSALWIAGIFLIDKKKYLLGAGITALGAASTFRPGHYQVVYYTFIILMIYFIYKIYESIKRDELPHFFKSSVIATAAIALGAFTTTADLLMYLEYTPVSQRGGTELRITDTKVSKSGLDRDYALGTWNYGKMETLTLAFPNIFGGGSSAKNIAKKDGEITKYFKKQGHGSNAQRVVSSILYWGSQGNTAGPAYYGIIIIFLFIIGLFILEAQHKWWLLAVTIMSIFISWGDNFTLFSTPMWNFFPLYQKFRSVNMALIIGSFSTSVLALMAFHKVLNTEKMFLSKYTKPITISAGILCGIALIIYILGPSMTDFGVDNPSQQGLLLDERTSLMRSEALKGMFLVIVAAALFYAFIFSKIKKELLILVLGLIILVDFWIVGKQYLNDSDFVNNKQKQNIEAKMEVENRILADKDLHFRVLNLKDGIPFNESRTSRYLRSIGGYSASKIMRYQELIERQISKNNMKVIDMLDTKYIIQKDNKIATNPGAMGAAWFVNNIITVNTPDEELNGLTNFDPKTTCIINKKDAEYVQSISTNIDTLSVIKLSKYEPNNIIYTTESGIEKLAVLSEIYYNEGNSWQAFIDGKPINYIRCNYVLRAIKVPAGKHTIEFKFIPRAIKIGTIVNSITSISVYLLLIIGLVKEGMVYYKTKKN